MKKLIGYFLSPIHYIFFGGLLLIFHPIQWLCLKTGGYKAHKTSVDILNGLLSCTYMLLGSRARFVNNQALPGDRPIIFVANHQSMYDIPPLIWGLRKHHAKFVSKIELASGIPSISFNLKHGGAANIDRKDKKQSMGELLKLGSRMQEKNWSAVIFPEGTRSRNGEMKPFMTGGVSILLKKVPNALIVPVAINGSWKFFRHGKFPLSTFEKMSWTILAPIESAGRPAEEVLQEAENAVRKSIENQH
ncbi:lysophospholipid acyltransferase family protein [Chitinophaga sancti]|uniref:1-acyl-sn-glycerol-3-phosphate acyltransferase n=1 Tax=Chitinophaga sancti TaxID=1004 RepID=A0A1K1SXD7_9BACT|nr:lysophospholipid acyltransferase family protein [Chitinophaga sancti]WQD62265.1 lysophospholipid acyltransferase family protein [Chitinophaga sancti]WQG92166.1 lysophospholipid acyltransferase family protein [Chitinophaga sancti]SFW88908.1 1-acyl-sn-glycerol-3-phosphate acyltransferase [Chitinophaga sancti]